MALTAEELIEIERLLAADRAEMGPFVELRHRFPQLAWVRCDASDVADQPFRQFPRFDLHLIDGSDHCVQITADPTRATGIVLAKRNVRR
ncbi:MULTISPECIES: DUF6129 family protein [unclassified Bradyrhizobium]|uniref:DUF6129 family protein n=1 Tax=unclassified Bradyrhizobium TaxID=2631580 RepID=UPI001CD2E9F9|nr:MULTISPECIES: DUF6129 family protein [unclassified Bradyrhizobium]MCA1384260.1 hypothetical protein [Bradyrhizobium sp. BRP05]MCA1393583.1 hypothetical protein [Bradyrhizobium sp. IC3123]MCA1421002.1 hypothetical protein [Bradyrhizobium sp. BRP23]MCA1430728.1 hypothetical protein [Bradyrhizobium sp. NBAIM16]MCA1436303.1 hypothetical protein [Bradyrhizobium sp. BRP20]